MLIRPPIGENLGPDILDVDWFMWNRTGGAVAIGTYLVADLERSQAESLSNNPKHPASVWKQGILATTTAAGQNPVATGFGHFVQELNSSSNADNTQVKCRVAGIGSALVNSSAGGNPAIAVYGVKCIPVAGAAYVNADVATALTATAKCCAITQDLHAGGATPLVVTCAITAWQSPR